MTLPCLLVCNKKIDRTTCQSRQLLEMLDVIFHHKLLFTVKRRARHPVNQEWTPEHTREKLGCAGSSTASPLIL